MRSPAVGGAAGRDDARAAAFGSRRAEGGAPGSPSAPQREAAKQGGWPTPVGGVALAVDFALEAQQQDAPQSSPHLQR